MDQNEAIERIRNLILDARKCAEDNRLTTVISREYDRDAKAMEIVLAFAIEMGFDSY